MVPVLLGLLVLASGCSKIEIDLNCYQSHDLPCPAPGEGATICLAARTTPPEPLLEAELCDKLRRLLETRGFQVLSEGACEYTLFADAAVDGGSTSTDYTPVTTGGDYVRSYVYDRRGRFVVVNRQIPYRTRYVPYTYTVFTSGLGLTLTKQSPGSATTREADELVPQAEETVWRSTASTTTGSSDLRWLVNHMLIVSLDHFGQDTGKQKRVGIAEDDKRVRRLAGPESQSPDDDDD
jgi:hypothetical protein